MIGLIGAMEMEISGLVACMEQTQTESVSGILFYIGTIEGMPCVVAKCGAGKVNAAICAEAMILKYAPEAVINLGVAGGVGAEVKIGDAVIADAVVQHDLDTTALGEERGFISGLDTVYLKPDSLLNRALQEAAETVYPARVHVGVIATGDQFIAGGDALHAIAQTFHAQACEMEGGSIGHVCAMNQVPFAVFRAISDQADHHADLDFPQFAREASARSSRLICTFLKNWKNA